MSSRGSCGVLPVVLGAAAVVLGRRLLRLLLLAKFRRDVQRLNDGDVEPMLAAYADGAVLRFHHGDHRWSGVHRGKAAIERFLREFTHAGVQGEIRELWLAGPPWALALVVRFDVHAAGPAGNELYRNRSVLVVRTRWGRVVKEDDFFEDTGRIEAFEAALRDVGIEPLRAQ